MSILLVQVKHCLEVQAISCVSGRTLVVVPSVSQISVWQKYIDQHFNNTNPKPRIGLFYGGGARKDRYVDIIISTYESALTHLIKEPFKLLIFDECHHFPANTYSRLAFLDADYRLGLSGSPYREDGRSELIYGTLRVHHMEATGRDYSKKAGLKSRR